MNQQQFERMHRALQAISKHYLSPEKLRKECGRGYGAGIEYQEALEMAYENMQSLAKSTLKGIRLPKQKASPKPS